MVTAYVLIATKTGEEEKAFEGVNKAHGVTEAHRVYGAYDIVTRIDVDSQGDMTASVEELRRTPGIHSTLTLTDADSL